MLPIPAYLSFAHALADRRRYLSAPGTGRDGGDASDAGSVSSADSADADRENTLCRHMDGAGFYHAAAITTHKNLLKGPRLW